MINTGIAIVGAFIASIVGVIGIAVAGSTDKAVVKVLAITIAGLGLTGAVLGTTALQEKTDTTMTHEEKIEEKEQKTVVAYQVAQDGEMQITFEDGSYICTSDTKEIIDYTVENVENTDFIMELQDCFEAEKDKETQTDLVRLHILIQAKNNKLNA